MSAVESAVSSVASPERVFPPPPDFAAKAPVGTMDRSRQMNQRAF